jgi:putative transcriptional regulator
MPIVVNLDIMLATRKMTLTELSEQVGLSIPNLSILKSGKGKAIRYVTMDKICKALDCQPGDLFKSVTEEEYNKLFKL